MAAAANPIEQLKAAKDGLDILQDVSEIAARHGGWETLDPGDRERLKWVGAFFRKTAPGQFMVRVRITNGQANAMQLRALAHITRHLGNGVLDLTTRQQVQLRAVKITDLPMILEALEEVDLTSLQTGMDNVRNITSCALAGVTPTELFDASPVGVEFTRMVLGNRAFTNLPRKLNVSVTGCPGHCCNAETQDIALTPAVRSTDGQPGFNVAVGGKMGSGGMTLAQPLDVFVTPAVASRIVAEIVLLFRDEGFRGERNRARLAFLVEVWGSERLRAALERRWGTPLERAQTDARLAEATDHMGVQPQKQSQLFSIGICVPTGRLTADALEEVARLADVYGDGQVRLTQGQNLILPNVAAVDVERVLREPLLEEFSPDPHPFSRGLVTCTGTDYCHLALIDTKTVAKRVTEAMEKRFPRPPSLSMHWSGCPSGCGNHQAADIGFLGARTLVNGKLADAVSIFVGGRTGANPRVGRKIMDIVPLDMLDDVLPFIIQNLESVKGVDRDIDRGGLVVMAPAFAKI